jgi:hypothetical protein
VAGKSFIPLLQPLRGPNPDHQRVQDNINTAFSGLQNGIADGVLAVGVSVPASGGTIRNPLGRKAQGMLMVAQSGPFLLTLVSSTSTTAVVAVSFVVTAAQNSAGVWEITGVAQPGTTLTATLWWF